MLSPSESPIRAEGLLERELAEFGERLALREYLLPAPAPGAAVELVRPSAS